MEIVISTMKKHIKIITVTSPLYKIGVTNKNIGERFKGDLHRIQIVFTQTFASGKLALSKEKNSKRNSKNSDTRDQIF